MPDFPNRSYPATRMRRVRRHDWSRRLVAETQLSISDLIWPWFMRSMSLPGVATMMSTPCAAAWVTPVATAANTTTECISRAAKFFICAFSVKSLNIFEDASLFSHKKTGITNPSKEPGRSVPDTEQVLVPGEIVHSGGIHPVINRNRPEIK